MGTLSRAAHDYYQDQPEAAEALLRAERFSGLSWDPACGVGTIPKVLSTAGLDCIGSDIVDRGYRHANRGPSAVSDFLTDRPMSYDVDNIISNPPFILARTFTDKALAIARHKVAFLLPLTFLEGAARTRWLETTPLARVHVFAWRISMPPGELYQSGAVRAEGGKKAFAWFVWDQEWAGPPQVRFLHKTADVQTSDVKQEAA